MNMPECTPDTSVSFSFFFSYRKKLSKLAKVNYNSIRHNVTPLLPAAQGQITETSHE